MDCGVSSVLVTKLERGRIVALFLRNPSLGRKSERGIVSGARSSDAECYMQAVSIRVTMVDDVTRSRGRLFASNKTAHFYFESLAPARPSNIPRQQEKFHNVHPK